MSFSKLMVVIVTVIAAAIGLGVPSTEAQEGGSGLQISPTRTEVSAEPGQQKNFSITVKNITQGDLTAQAVINDFESDNVTGTPKIIVDPNKRTPYTLANMIKGLENFDLKSGESKEVKLSIEVPANAAPGAYFGAVRYIAVPRGQAPVNEDAQTQVALTASVAHLVFVAVPGEITEQIQIESLKVLRDGSDGSFFTSPPNKSSIVIKNLGNGFSRPFGKVVVRTSSGNEVYTYEVNNSDPKGIILPNSSRTFDDELKDIKRPGKYKTIASVAYGNGGEVVNYETSFWYLPLWFLGLLALVVILLVGGGYFAYKKFVAGKTKK